MTEQEGKYTCEERIVNGLENVNILRGIDISVTYLNSVLAGLPEPIREKTRKKIIDRIGV